MLRREIESEYARYGRHTRAEAQIGWDHNWNCYRNSDLGVEMGFHLRAGPNPFRSPSASETRAERLFCWQARPNQRRQGVPVKCHEPGPEQRQ